MNSKRCICNVMVISLVFAMLSAFLGMPVAYAQDKKPVKTEKVAEGITHLIYADGSEEWDITARGPEKHMMQFVPSPAQNREEPKPGKADVARGYITFSPKGRDGVLPEYIPAASEVTNKVSIFASPGEYEPATFAIRPLKDLSIVKFSCDSFIGPRGAKIASSSIEISIVEPTVEQIGQDSNKCKWMAKWLRPDNTAKASARKNVQIYVDVHVPDNAKPGIYSGKVTIRSENGKTSSVAVSLEVLPLKLARSMPWGAFRYDWLLKPQERADFHRFDLAEMRRAGLTQCTISPIHYANEWGPSPGVNPDGSVDFTIWDQCIDLYKEAGFADPPIVSMEGLLAATVIGGMGKSMGKDGTNKITAETLRKAEEYPDDIREFVKRVVRRVYDHSLEVKWPNFYVYLADEPYIPGMNIQTAKFMGDVAREVAPELQIAETAYYEDAWERLHNLLDLNMVIYRFPCGGDKANRTWHKLAEKENSKLYGMDFIGSYDTLWEGRSMTFTVEKGGLDGMMVWVQWVSDEFYLGSPERPLFSPYMFLNNWWKGGPFCLREKDGRVWRSLAWIGVREGIDDSRYVRTLRRVIDDATIAGNDQAAAKAQRSLDSVLNKVHWVGDTRKTVWDSAHADAARRGLADAAIEYQESLGKVTK